MKMYNRYQSGIFGNPDHEPAWLMEGISILGGIVKKEEEKMRQEVNRGR